MSAKAKRDKEKRSSGQRPDEMQSDQVGMPSAQADLSPTARRLLEAARRLLERQGYEALTLEAIGREAGENKSLVWYHFGGKPGLLVALADWILYDQLRELHNQIGELPPGERRAAVSHRLCTATGERLAAGILVCSSPCCRTSRATERPIGALQVCTPTIAG